MSGTSRSGLPVYAPIGSGEFKKPSPGLREAGKALVDAARMVCVDAAPLSNKIHASIAISKLDALKAALKALSEAEVIDPRSDLMQRLPEPEGPTAERFASLELPA